jgi:hypothetical protein
MTDIAEIGFRADTAALVKAEAAIDAIIPAAKQADKAADQLSASLEQLNSAGKDAAAGVTKAGAGASAASGEMAALNAQTKMLANSTRSAASGLTQFDSHMTAYRKNLIAVGKETSRTARLGLNMSRQFADIGVTAAMGMNPLMIAIQQGPQLFDLLQERALMTGKTVGAVFRGMAASAMAFLAPFLPIILGIAAVVGTVAAAWGLATRSMGKDIGDVTKGMHLTEAQLERLKDKGVKTSITMGDSFKGFFMTIGDGFKAMFGPQLKWLSDTWTKTLDGITGFVVKFVKLIVGYFIGAFNAMRIELKMLPGAFMDMMTMAANGVIGIVEWMVNNVIKELRMMANVINKGAELVGVNPIFGEMENVKLGRLANNHAGQAAATAAALTAGFEEGLATGDKLVDQFAKRWRENSTKAAQGRITKAAGKPGAAGGKTEAEKAQERFQDIVQGAQGEIDVLKQQAAAVGMSTEAMATLEMQTKLLNQAREKELELTGPQLKILNDLAVAYGKAAAGAERTQAMFDLRKGIKSDQAALEAEAKLIGLTGEALAYQAKMTELLARAEAARLPITSKLMIELDKAARAYAGQSATNDNARFMDGILKSHEETMRALQAEAAAIGLTGVAAEQARIEFDLLAQARRANVTLTPEEIAALKEHAKEQAVITEQIRTTREALDFARGATRGFIDDMRNGLAQGQSFWESFGNAVINVLNKIIDKLTDQALDVLFGGPSAGGGGFWSAIKVIAGGIFGGGGGAAAGTMQGGFGGGSTMFAAKGAVLNGPTAFNHAGGTTIGGEAGEEALMPLKRGPDGSLGVQMYGGSRGGGGPQVVEVRVSAEPTEDLYLKVESIAQDKATETTKAGISQYDENILPGRVHEVANDARAR